jgi:3-hydroxyisobutyrate dehydrogenase-like beta-hydroxyacid dehydrogenase
MAKEERSPTIGFVGLGAMGSRIAGRFLTSGHRVSGTNRTASKAAGLIERGLVWRDTPREVAAAAEVTFSMVLDDSALEAVASGPDGILAGLTPGKLYVDMSTVSPDASRQLAQRVRDVGADMLDAPVSGSVPQAEAGNLTIMVGGEAAAFTSVEPLLRQLGTPTRIGENGQGLVLKLAINISLGVQMLAFAEGLLLAERSGIDREIAATEMAASPIGSPMLKARVPLVLDLPDEAWFDVRKMQKDLSLALETGRRLEVPLPSTAVANELLTTARALGYGERDIAAVFEVFEELSGGEPMRTSG